MSTQSAAPDDAWALLTMLLEPETLYSYTHLRWAVPPRKSILGRGYLQRANTQQMVDLWLRYGRPPFNPPRYAAVSQAIEATFQAVVVSKQQAPGEGASKLVDELEKIARAITPPTPARPAGERSCPACTPRAGLFMAFNWLALGIERERRPSWFR